MHASASHQKGQAGRCDAKDKGIWPRDEDQRKWHDGKAAKLTKRAKPDIRYAPPAKYGAMRIRPMADQRTEWCDQ